MFLPEALLADIDQLFGKGPKRGDYSLQGKRARLRLLEKGNKKKLVLLHHEAEQYLDAWLEAAGITDPPQPCFRA